MIYQLLLLSTIFNATNISGEGCEKCEKAVKTYCDVKRPLACSHRGAKAAKMLTFAKLSLVTVTSLSLVQRTTCFSMGAPDSACAQMTPGHAHESQTGAPPANFTLSKKVVQPGQMIGIELSTTDNSQFKGFIIQARAVKQKDRQVRTLVLCKS